MGITFRVNIHAMFYLTKAAVPHMKPGSVIMNTASDQCGQAQSDMLAYATTKGAIQNSPPAWLSCSPKRASAPTRSRPARSGHHSFPRPCRSHSQESGKNVPMKRPGQRAEIAPAYVMLADPLSSYMSGATIAVQAESRFQDIPRTEIRGNLCAEAQKILTYADNGCCNSSPP